MARLLDKDDTLELEERKEERLSEVTPAPGNETKEAETVTL